MTLTAGASLGPYRILEQTGRGGMATVYKAYQASLARNVAIKVLPAFFAEDPGFRERFQQEAIAIAKLRHPNILAVYDYGEEAGLTYIVSEFVDGGTLADQIGAPLTADYVVRILGPIASALDYAHARGVVHRDIKPSNVLLARDGTPILSDFGLAKMVGSMPRLTQTGTTVGTPEYMAPEQAMGESLGPSADLYALAVVAYEMLTGRVPFTAETPLAVLLAHAHKPLPLPTSVNPALAPGLEAALLKGLAKQPADRYPTATELVRAIEDASRGRTAAVAVPAEAAAARSATRGVIPSTSLRPIAMLGGAALGVLILGGVVLALSARPPAPAVDDQAGGPGAALSSPLSTAGGATPSAAADATSVPASPTPEPTPTPQPTEGPGAPLALKGDLVAEVELDEDQTALQFAEGFPNAESGQVIGRDGELELAVLRTGGSAVAAFVDWHPETYVTELDLRFSKDARIDLVWQMYPGGPGQGFPQVRISAASGSVQLGFVEFSGDRGAERRLGSRVPLADLRTGQDLTISLVVTGAKYLLFVDGKQVLEVAEERTSDGSPTLAAEGFSGRGSVIITGLRMYEYAGD